MASASKLADLDLAAFAAALADPGAGLGAGPAAALALAAGAGLVSMAFRPGAGEPAGDAAIWSAGRADELDVLRADALALAESARSGAAGSQAEEPAGKRARAEATEPAFELMETALAALRIAAAGASGVPAERRAACAAGGALLFGALDAAGCALEGHADLADEVRVVRVEGEALLAEVRAAGAVAQETSGTPGTPA
jgi:hypothetical protein